MAFPLLLLASLAYVASVHAKPWCSRLDAACIGVDPTELIQKKVEPALLQPVATDLHSDQDFADFREEAARVVAEMADLHAEAVEPMLNFAENELKQLARDITAKPMTTLTTDSVLNIDLAELQAEIRAGMQNMVHFPTPPEALPAVVKALGADGGNLTLPRGTYLHLAESLALVKHHVTQDTELQDMVVSLIPAMARTAQEKSLFESLEAADDLAEKGMFFPKSGNGTPGGRDVLSRLPDMARQSIRAVKLMQPALDSVVNGSVRRTQGGFCDDPLTKKISRWVTDHSNEEKKKMTCNKGGKLCLTLDPAFDVGHYFIWNLFPKNSRGSTGNGLNVGLSVGLNAAISGESYRKWKKLGYLLAAEKGRSAKLEFFLDSLMFMGMALHVNWQTKYLSGKKLGLLTELGFLLKHAQRQSPLSSLSVILNYGDDKGIQEPNPNPTGMGHQGAMYTYANWGSTINQRIVGSTTVDLYTTPLKDAKHYGGVAPKFGLTLGDLQWSSTWPVQLASSWSWKSKWQISPKRKWSGLGSSVSIPFLGDCVVQKEEDVDEDTVKVREVKKLMQDHKGLRLRQAMSLQGVEKDIERLNSMLQKADDKVKSRLEEIEEAKEKESERKQKSGDKLKKYEVEEGVQRRKVLEEACEGPIKTLDKVLRTAKTEKPEPGKIDELETELQKLGDTLKERRNVMNTPEDTTAFNKAFLEEVKKAFDALSKKVEEIVKEAPRCLDQETVGDPFNEVKVQFEKLESHFLKAQQQQQPEQQPEQQPGQVDIDVNSERIAEEVQSNPAQQQQQQPAQVDIDVNSERIAEPVQSSPAQQQQQPEQVRLPDIQQERKNTNVRVQEILEDSEVPEEGQPALAEAVKAKGTGRIVQPKATKAKGTGRKTTIVQPKDPPSFE